MADPFYKTKRWQQRRAAILKRDKYQCQVAKRLGRTVNADTVHHIFPRDEYPEHAWASWNLIAVSRDGHNMLHDRTTGRLSPMGEDLMRETGRKVGLEKDETILIIGNPGTGKTELARRILRGGVAYDLDAIAAAFRLTDPKAERHWPARRLANSMAGQFAEAARRYCGRVIVIRTAPTIEEIEEIRPDRLIALHGNFGNEDLPPERRKKIANRILEAVRWAKLNGIEVEERE